MGCCSLFLVVMEVFEWLCNICNEVRVCSLSIKKRAKTYLIRWSVSVYWLNSSLYDLYRRRFVSFGFGSLSFLCCLTPHRVLPVVSRSWEWRVPIGVSIVLQIAMVSLQEGFQVRRDHMVYVRTADGDSWSAVCTDDNRISYMCFFLPSGWQWPLGLVFESRQEDLVHALTSRGFPQFCASE